MLEDVGPGVEALVRWSAIVNTPLPGGTTIDAKAHIEWDGARLKHDVEAITAARVRAPLPAFAVRAEGLPFNISGVVAREGVVELLHRRRHPCNAPRIADAAVDSAGTRDRRVAARRSRQRP